MKRNLRDENEQDAEMRAGSDKDNEENDQTEETESASGTSGPKKKKKRYSPIWEHFSIKADGKVEIAHCNYCKKTYTLSGKSNGSTSNLNRHMRNVHPDLYSSTSASAEEIFEFSQERYRAALMKWIVTCNQPFTEVEKEEFLDLIRTLNPDAITVSSETVKRDIIEKFENKVKEIKLVLSKVPGKISFTMDAWTSKNVLPFLAIRAHWISVDWVYETTLVDFSHIDGSHGGENLCNIFLQCLKRFDIPLSKVLSLTMDNATPNNTLMESLQKHGIKIGVKVSAEENRVRCMAHILNLAVQDILESLKIPLNYEEDLYKHLDEEDVGKITEATSEVEVETEENEDDEGDEGDEETDNQPTILKLRKLVKKVRRSPQMRQKLRKHCEFYGMEYLVPKIDVSTRWNSTYEMIVRAETLKKPLRAICLNEKKLQKLLMNEAEWNALKSLKILLGKFERSTELISMARHTTIPAYIPTLNWLLESLELFIEDNPGAMGEAAEIGLKKLKKYDEELHIKKSQIPYVAMFLNPALKMNYFKEHDYSKASIKEIQKSISELFEKVYDGGERTVDMPKEETPDEFFSHMFKRSTATKQPKEFQKYLNSPLSDPKVDILDFWRSQKDELPKLTKMARDYLGAQSGSVAVERDFSGGVDLITPTRCSLLPQTIRACMCLKSWYKFSKSDPAN